MVTGGPGRLGSSLIAAFYRRSLSPVVRGLRAGRGGSYLWRRADPVPVDRCAAAPASTGHASPHAAAELITDVAEPSNRYS